MAQLVAKHYPTVLFGKAADHTYVECGTGTKGWSCWGGKAGGKALHVGNGSSKRADLIAQLNERAGVSCYLINGVCHQAANRILLPAGIIVMAARGYAVSSALFGAYGRPAGVFGFCTAPFMQHPGVTGDLPACVPPGGLSRSTPSSKTGGKGDSRFRRYVTDILHTYSQAESLFLSKVPDKHAIEDFHVTLFMRDVRFKLRGPLRVRTLASLKDIRRTIERARLSIEQRYFEKQLSLAEFVEEFNQLTITFQHAIAGVLTAQEYRRLFDLPRGEVIVLADPSIVGRQPLER